jgi:hypothetical protein
MHLVLMHLPRTDGATDVLRQSGGGEEGRKGERRRFLAFPKRPQGRRPPSLGGDQAAGARAARVRWETARNLDGSSKGQIFGPPIFWGRLEGATPGCAAAAPAHGLPSQIGHHAQQQQQLCALRIGGG